MTTVSVAPFLPRNVSVLNFARIDPLSPGCRVSVRIVGVVQPHEARMSRRCSGLENVLTTGKTYSVSAATATVPKSCFCTGKTPSRQSAAVAWVRETRATKAAGTRRRCMGGFDRGPVSTIP